MIPFIYWYIYEVWTCSIVVAFYLAKQGNVLQMVLLVHCQILLLDTDSKVAGQGNGQGEHQLTCTIQLYELVAIRANSLFKKNKGTRALKVHTLKNNYI